MMKIALIGATGFVGSAILKEALQREHQVKAIVRNPEKVSVNHEQLSVVKGNAMDINQLAELLKGIDVVISAYNAGWGNPNLYQEFLQGAQNIQESVKRSGKTLSRHRWGRELVYFSEPSDSRYSGFP